MTVLGQVYLSSLCQSGAGLLMVLMMLWIFGRGRGGREYLGQFLLGMCCWPLRIPSTIKQM